MLPVFVLVGLTFALLLWMASARTRALTSRQIKHKDIALGQQNWPERATQIGNCFRNQFELPVLFYILIALALPLRHVDYVLLMLSSKQPPPPEEEVCWHAARCRSHGSTWLVTTRVLTEMNSGESVVAFYGNADLHNRYLGQGVYLDYVRLDTPEGQQLLQTSSLYSDRGIPDGAQGFIHLRDVREPQDGEQLESLHGVITSRGVSDGLPLALDNIPDTAARLQVYYRRQRAQA